MYIAIESVRDDYYARAWISTALRRRQVRMSCNVCNINTLVHNSNHQTLSLGQSQTACCIITGSALRIDTCLLTPHAGDWFHSPPITAVELRLSDEAVRVAVAHRLGGKACEPHTCIYGKAVDAHGLHGLSCRKTAPRQHHSQLNNIIWRAIKEAQMPAVKEPVSLMWDDNKRPDGTTLVPWATRNPWPGM